jgi:hypothetical protein
MADQPNPRSYRAIDQQPDRESRTGSSVSGQSDPLAELARLIGQSDPFVERERARAEPLYEPRAEHPVLARAWQPRSTASAADQESNPPADEPRYEADYQDQFQPHQTEGDSGECQSAFSVDQPAYAAEQRAFDEAEYDEELARRRRQRRLATVLAIVGFAVVGGAAAYGYRTYFVHRPTGSSPPVIAADTGPTKVVPVGKTGDSANKLSYERVGEAGRSEKIVPREEKPVDVKAAAVMPPRAVYTTPAAAAVVAAPRPTVAVTGPSTSEPALPVASSSAPPNTSGAIFPSAKKIKTVTIRPDMTVVGDVAQPRMAASPPARSPAPTRSAAPPQTTPAAPAPAHTATARPQRQANAPLSLAPGAEQEPPRPSQPPSAATRAVDLASTGPAAPSGEATSAVSGGFAVQIASQRSEADAKASFRSLQSRYPNILGGRQSYIRRADLGSKGVYYRTLIGPFATADQAAAFCTSLKAAGGHCLIHRN